RVRYTEWRDWETGGTTARELYDHAADPAEKRNAVDDAALLPEREAAARLLAARFPRIGHAAAVPAGR
ncbi:MAG: hypothetical protein EBX35_08380, partial [Planctomycetia bacterium]|nr:hypothetical protein [Planctomycetia bacterium]